MSISRRRWLLACGALLAVARPTEAKGAGEPEHVVLTYAAPAECPERAVFDVTIRARIATNFRLDFHLRDVVYDQAEESPVIAPPGEPSFPGSRGNPATWYAPSNSLTNRVELLVGFTFGR